MELGVFNATITSNNVRETRNGSVYIEMMCAPDGSEDGEAAPLKLWMTEKAAFGTAQALAQIGFDLNVNGIDVLAADRHLLAGKKVRVNIEDRGYGFEANLVMGEVSKDRMLAMTERLRSAKPPVRRKKPGNSEADPADGEETEHIPF